MHEYDIIIIGAGMAGAGAAFNLKKEMPNTKILLIDKKEAGANKGYGFRNTTQDIIREYKIPFTKIYKGIKGGTAGETLFKLNKKFYLINYQDCCQNLIKKSGIDFKIETATNLGKTTLKTNKAIYKFKYLIDCSGHNFFTRNSLSQKKPFKYWVGITRKLENKLPDQNYFYYQFSDTGHMDEIYPLKNQTLQGDWQYQSKINFSKINPPKQNLLKKLIPNPTVKSETQSVIPCAPSLPLVHKNIFSLGNSFGNPTTSSAEGIAPTLQTSKILASAIKNNRPKDYETNWKKIYFNNYLKFLTLKYYGYNNSKTIRKIKGTPPIKTLCKKFSKHPHLFEKMLMCDPTISLPDEIKKIYPKRKILFQAGCYGYLKLKFLKDKL